MSRTGISTLFPSFPKEMSVYDRAYVTVKRHQNGYFKDWSFERMDQEEIPLEWRPSVLVSSINAHHLNKNEVSRNRRLAFVMESSLQPENSWACDFVTKLKDGTFTTVTAAKDEASTLWKTHSCAYDSRRAVHLPSLNGRGHVVRKTRKSTESESDYRKRIRLVESDTTDSDVAARLASYHSRALRILSMKRPQLNNAIQENASSVASIQGQIELPTRTVDETRVVLLLAELHSVMSSRS